MITSLNVQKTNELRFIGEGNEHIVFGLVNTKCVLRFRKFPTEEKIRREELMLRVQDDLSFINDVARPLAGPLLVDEARIISVDPDVLDKVVNIIKPLRDEKRFVKVINPFGIGIQTPNVSTEFITRQSSKLENSPTILCSSFNENKVTVYPTVFLPSSLPQESFDEFESLSESQLKSESQDESQLTQQESQKNIQPESQKRILESQVAEPCSTQNDLSSPHVLCIELKPKQGYLELGPKGNKICRFCLKQFQKVQTKTESFRSSYCPSDLFSGNPSRMIRALHNLFSAPQNNLKIFSSGKRVRDLNQYRQYCELIVEILMFDEMGHNQETSQLQKENQEQEKDQLSQETDQLKRQIQSTEKIQKQNLETNNLLDQKPNTDPLQNEKSLTNLQGIPSASVLAPSSFLGRILYLQFLGHIYEVEAAKLYKEMQNRTSSKGELHRLLSDFEFLKPDKSERYLKLFKLVKSEQQPAFGPVETEEIKLVESKPHQVFEPAKAEVKLVKSEHVFDPAKAEDLKPVESEQLVFEPAKTEKLKPVKSEEHVSDHVKTKELVSELPKAEELKPVKSGEHAFDSAKSEELVDTTKEKNRQPGADKMRINENKLTDDISNLESSVICQILQECLIAMSSKDASLMMLIEGPYQRNSNLNSAKTVENSPFWLEFPKRSGKMYRCQMSLVDIALKSAQKILEHESSLGKLEDIFIRLKAEANEPICCKKKDF